MRKQVPQGDTFLAGGCKFWPQPRNGCIQVYLAALHLPQGADCA